MCSFRFRLIVLLTLFVSSVSFSQNILAEVFIMGQPSAYSMHWWDDEAGTEDYSVGLGVEVYSPQGPSAISSVTVIAPDETVYTLYDDGSYGDETAGDSVYSYWRRGGTLPPLIGEYTFNVADIYGYSDTGSDEIEVILGVPQNPSPRNRDIITGSTFTLSWDEVPGATSYYITIYDEDWNTVWEQVEESGISSAYNEDESDHALIDGEIYYWSIIATDNSYNHAHSYNIEFFYSASGVNSGEGSDRGFDYMPYLSANPDLPSDWGIEECMSHYILFGFWENRAVAFNLDEYLNANPDLPSNWTYEEALNHYNVFGRNENRLLAFSADEYLSLYPDLPQDWTYDQAWAHYIYFGKQEGRIASFDETAYLELYLDLPRSWGQTEAFYHYLLYGIYEGRVYDPYDESVFTKNIIDFTKYYEDADGDSYGDPNSSMEATSQPTGYVLDNSDCDDSDIAIHPGATEICGDGIDQNCNGADTACSSETDFDGNWLGTTSQEEPISFSVSDNWVMSLNFTYVIGASTWETEVTGGYLVRIDGLNEFSFVIPELQNNWGYTINGFCSEEDTCSGTILVDDSSGTTVTWQAQRE